MGRGIGDLRDGVVAAKPGLGVDGRGSSWAVATPASTAVNRNKQVGCMRRFPRNEATFTISQAVPLASAVEAAEAARRHDPPKIARPKKRNSFSVGGVPLQSYGPCMPNPTHGENSA